MPSDLITSYQAKVCVDCGEEKSVDDFYRQGRKRNPELRQPDCKLCRKAKVAAWHQANLSRSRERSRWASVKHKYGLTKEQYLALLAKQDGRCALCRTDDPAPHNFFSVDHDHRCCPGEKSCGSCVRGLLCVRCNSSLGWMEEHLPDIWLYLHVPHSGWQSLQHLLDQVTASAQ